MDLELTGRSCIRSTMTQPITIDSEPGSLAEDSLHSEMLWYAGYTASRHEKRVAEHFAQRGVEHFLPLYETIHRWNNGRHWVRLPLFPGYIFVRIALRDRLRVIEVPGFVRLVGFSSLPCPLPEADINKMKEALNKGVLAEPYPYLTAGTRVEIKNGPLQGMTGILLRRQNKCRVVISVDLIMRSMSVEVEAGDVVSIRKSGFNIGQSPAGGKTTDQQVPI
jgi:transcription antitermination factor NusG